MVVDEARALEEIPNFRHLRAFREVARLGGISHAAGRVHLSQPAITQAIAKLENQLGLPLFERQPTGMTLTAAGTVFLARVERLLDHLRAGARDAQKVGQRRGGGRGFVDFDQMLTVAQVRALIAIGNTGNFSLAARSVSLSQPSLHRAARDLERLAGMALFNRGAAGIGLTAPARVLIQHVMLALAELRQGFSEVAAMRGVARGRIVVGSMPLARSVILPSAITELARAHPATGVSVIDGPYDDLLHGLRHGAIDLLIGALRDPVPIDDVEQEPLFTDPLAVIARTAHPLAAKPHIGGADLAASRWVLPRPGTPTRDRFAAILAAYGIPEPAGIIEASSLDLIRGLLLSSDMLTLLSPHQIRRDRDMGLLASLPVALAGAERPIGLTVRRGWRPTPVQQDFLVALRRAGIAAAAPGIG
jgi:LysR family transcriptional regulator, regulator for genes of the gallate degradation pathway